MVMDNEKTIKEITKIIKESDNIVFFGGAGLSTESGIPDFRSVDGLYNQKYKYPPEIMLSHTFFMQNPEEFYRFYKDKCLSPMLKAEPNAAHMALAKLESMGKLKAIVTQNIDGLHQKAGSKNVYEIHGSVLRNYCNNCNKEYDSDYIFKSKGVPKCKCGGLIRPDVVLYGEMLPPCFMEAQYHISASDLLIVAGTSLTVEPASSLVRLHKNNRVVIINNDKTSYDNYANLVINSPLGEVFSKLK